MSEQNLSSIIEPILSKYSETTLAARWREATSFGAGSDFLAFWVRDSGYVVNIVWLNSDGIRDITLLMYAEEAQTDNEGANGEVPEHAHYNESMFNFLPLSNMPEHAHYNESMFNFLPLSNIIAFEVREGPNVAHQFGLGVNGKKLVHVIANAPRGQLYWVAETEEESNNLDSFFNQVLSTYLLTL